MFLLEEINKQASFFCFSINFIAHIFIAATDTLPYSSLYSDIGIYNAANCWRI